MGRAVLYTRVSSKAQEDGYSLETQQKDGRAYCQAHGHTVVEPVETDTFTGFDSLEERGGMQRAIQRIRRGEADTLVVWRIDRAGRFSLDNQLLLRDVSRAGGSLESVSEGLIPNTADGRFKLDMYSYVGDKEREDLKQRSERGLRERVEMGHILVGGVPLYGYHWSGPKKENYAIDQESAPVVEDIYHKADAGWSVRRICRWLNETGISTPSKLLHSRGELPETYNLAEKWSPQMVYTLLTRESYTGRHAARRSVAKKTKVWIDGQEKTKLLKRIRPETDVRRVALTIPTIIPPDLWQRVQDKVKTRQLDWSKEAADEPLLNKGIAICGMCGKKMIATRHPRGRYRIYLCSMRTGWPADTAHVCPGGAFAVRASEVDQDIWNRVKAIIKDDARFTRLVRSKEDKQAEMHAETVRRLENVAAELKDTKARQATVYQRMTGETDDTIYAMHRAQLQRLNGTVAELEKRASELQDSLDDIARQQDGHKLLLALVDHLTQPRLVYVQTSYDDALDSLTREEKRSILHALDVKVPMYPVNSDFARANEHRWDFLFSNGVALSHGTA